MNNGAKRKMKVLKEELEKAQQEYSKAFRTMGDKSLEEYEAYLEPLANKVLSLTREVRFIQKPKYEAIPSYSDIMTLDEFIDSVKEGSFDDYDGHGNYANAKQMTDIRVYPSDLKHNTIRREFTHVVWFNR